MKLTSLFLFVIFGTSLISAQGPGSGGKAKDNKPLPLQGKSLPDVSAFTETGEKIELRQALKGRHGVIVFGCLT